MAASAANPPLRPEAPSDEAAFCPGHPGLRLRPMVESDIGGTIALVSRTMNADEAGCAAETLHFHFCARRAGIGDGRILYALTDGPKVVGVAGLHHGAWGPAENVWLSWFALDPALRGQGVAGRMLAAVENEARRQNLMKLFIETYSTPEFARARAFYRSQGFAEVGGIPGWLPGGGDMVVYYKDLAPCA